MSYLAQGRMPEADGDGVRLEGLAICCWSPNIRDPIEFLAWTEKHLGW